MLTELRVENLGVIASLELVLGPGMTALTGETGAGKTMLVEAISLLVGSRADGGVLRAGSSEARIEGRFVVGDDEVVLARVVPADGRSRAYVNGRMATVATLAEEGVRLVDLHGQHSHQSLLGAATQRLALDRFGRVDLEPLRTARARLVEIDAALASMGGDARARAREVDLLRFQVAEIDSAAILAPDEDAVLEVEEDALADAAAHREAAARAVAALTDDGGALDAAAAAGAALGHRRPFEALAASLRDVAAQLADIASEVRAAGEAIEDDPERLEEVRARRHLLHELRRKYGDGLAEVLSYRDECAARLAELERHDATVSGLEAERAAAVAAERSAAKVVAAARRKAAKPLGAAVQAHFADLALGRASLDVRVGGDDPADDVAFLLAANTGEASGPLAKVASGGELARVMLALRLVLSEAPETLLFDEVDAGIGGEAALAVGRALARLGEDHQVLVVTHLAQVAAFATTQIGVRKHEADGRTLATAETLGADERRAEIARMLSGLGGLDSALRHADELLAAAGPRSA